MNNLTFHLELPTVNFKVESELIKPTLSILLSDFKIFRKNVFYVYSHFKGPDYFDLFENFSELQTLLDQIIKQLKIQLGERNNTSYLTFENSLELTFVENRIAINSDSEGIAETVAGLTNLIQGISDAVIVAEQLEEYNIKSFLLKFEKDLEKIHWIFYMFSKY